MRDPRLDRYNIVSPDDLEEASGRMEIYLRAQKSAAGGIEVKQE